MGKNKINGNLNTNKLNCSGTITLIRLFVVSQYPQRLTCTIKIPKKWV